MTEVGDDMPPPARGCPPQAGGGHRRFQALINHVTPVSTDLDKPRISLTWKQIRHRSCHGPPQEDSKPLYSRTYA